VGLVSIVVAAFHCSPFGENYHSSAIVAGTLERRYTHALPEAPRASVDDTII